MPRAICRCGQTLPMPADPSERVVCPGCGARVRIRRKTADTAGSASASKEPAEGVIRFFCPCGRRLKVSAASPPPFGKCPDCGKVVPVPATSLTTSRSPGHPESPTEELSLTDKAAIERWSAGHKAKAGPPAPEPEPAVMATMAFSMPQTDKVEVGMRICPECGQPIHMGAANCRQCGKSVPKR
jgi:hypothetical protein